MSKAVSIASTLLSHRLAVVCVILCVCVFVLPLCGEGVKEAKRNAQLWENVKELVTKTERASRQPLMTVLLKKLKNGNEVARKVGVSVSDLNEARKKRAVDAADTHYLCTKKRTDNKNTKVVSKAKLPRTDEEADGRRKLPPGLARDFLMNANILGIQSHLTPPKVVCGTGYCVYYTTSRVNRVFE